MTLVTVCTSCLALSTRPRITFDVQGRCNACVWAETKRTMDWSVRHHELESLLDRHRGAGAFDCLVPVSGGKDGSYVAYQLKHKYGMSPLCVTVSPPLPLELGEGNLRNFRESGFDHISVSPDPVAMQALNRLGLTKLGFPYYGWLIAIHTSIARVSSAFGINLVFYGEDGEVEYGGSLETEKSPIYGFDYQKQIYLEGGMDEVIKSSEIPDSSAYWFTYPTIDHTSQVNTELTHWSYYENWDPYRNYLVAKEHCGLEEADSTNSGTFTNFAQNDQALYSLHAYLMFLKFGFGRANQDASIEIRRGALDRHQGLSLVEIYDGEFPGEFLDQFLDYFQMSESQFLNVLDGFANKTILTRVSPGVWKRAFDYR